MTKACFVIIWPERRSVTEKTIRDWYSDAVADGDAVADLSDIYDIIDELQSIGYVTFERTKTR